VQHEKTNKSKVAGIEVNGLKDQKDVLKTIERVIAWAWEAAGENEATK